MSVGIPPVRRERAVRVPNAHCRQGDTPPPHFQHIDVVVYPGCNALIVVRNEILCA